MGEIFLLEGASKVTVYLLAYFDKALSNDLG